MKNFLKDLELATEWSVQTFQDLPWRKKRSFYNTLISEVMLQQTTVSTVKNRFDAFIKKYPDLKSLSLAKEDELLKLWQGLGYYNRAKRLKNAAEILVTTHEYTIESLLKVPGIGDYTANALMSIGLNLPALAIDVNMERVLLRYLGLQEISGKQKYSKEHLKAFFTQNLSKKIKNYRDFHEVIMDIGRTFCQARSRNCLQCPLKKNCKSYKLNKDLFTGIKKIKAKEKIQIELIRLQLISANKIYLVQRSKGQWLEGQWEVPSFLLSGKLNTKQYSTATIKNEKLNILYHFVSTITHHRIMNKVAVIDKKQCRKYTHNGKWFELGHLTELPITSVTAKIVKNIGSM